MKVEVKSIEPGDFVEIKDEVDQLKWICSELRTQCPGVRIDSIDTIGHPMRMWEWGRVLKRIKEVHGYPLNGARQRVSVLDVGTAVSLIGPALSYLGCNVMECDVDEGFKPERLKLKSFLDTFPDGGKFDWVQAGFGTLCERCVVGDLYDVVMSISTIEHVETSLELQAWKEMFDVLKPGGLMIVTMDCFPVAKKGYIYDDVRYTNYDMKLVRKRVDELKSYGMKVIGKEDYTWHGTYVDDGSFAWISMMKGKR